MGYSKDIYQNAIETIQQHRLSAEQEADIRKASFYKSCPRAQEIEHQLSATSIQAAKIVLSKGGNVKAVLQKLREQNQALQQEFNTLLLENGLTIDALQPDYSCKQCCDTGYRDGVMCTCLRRQLQKEACRKLNDSTPLALSTFESFDLSYYPDVVAAGAKLSPRQRMEQIFRYCQQYADQFSRHASSLLFVGGTGLSKTHLSLSIANVVLQKGFSVVYDSVQNIVTALEKEHFGRESELTDTNHTLMTCDLLILDDLGTEFRTQFVTATLYNLINTRLMASRPTIISTNLNTEEMQQYYSQRFVSRVSSNYIRLPFDGRDIRQLKAHRRLQKANDSK